MHTLITFLKPYTLNLVYYFKSILASAFMYNLCIDYSFCPNIYNKKPGNHSWVHRSYCEIFCSIFW